MNGPFAKGKEYVGGFSIIRVPVLDAALEWGRKLTRAVPTVYLIFNEGYTASAGERLVREDLCRTNRRYLGCWPTRTEPAGIAV